MTFSEKISALRKQKGWSQEELAEKLMVTRQAVSKWESAQSMPDLDKLVQLSEALGVSTDYLLKDEQAQSAPVPATAEQTVKPRHVTQEEARRYCSCRRQRFQRRHWVWRFACGLRLRSLGFRHAAQFLSWDFRRQSAQALDCARCW